MEIIVQNTNYESIAVVDTFESMIWTDRYNEYGDFELYFSMDPTLLDYMREDYYLRLKESEHVMIIEDLAIDSNVEEGVHVTITGRSLESLLERRIIWGQKTLVGNLQEGIKTLLEENIISPSIPERKIDNFIFEESTDPKITKLEVNAQYIGDDLYSIICMLCYDNDIGFKIVLNDENQLVFSLYAGVDRSYKQLENPYVIFSPNFENIINSNYYSSKANYRNVTFVVGEGDEYNWVTTSVGTASGIDRRELFTDARDTSRDSSDALLSDAEYLLLLQNMGTMNLNEHCGDTAFEGEVEATQLFKYGEDFFIGDIVQIANEYGHEGSVYISELVISQSEEGVSIYPTFKTIQDKEEESE